jgi:hypothetical protein
MIGFDTEDGRDQSDEQPRPRWRSVLALSGGFTSLVLVTMVLIVIAVGLVAALAWVVWAVQRMP